MKQSKTLKPVDRSKAQQGPSLSDTLDAIDRKNPSRSDDEEIQTRIKEKWQAAVGRDKSGLSDRHRMDLDLFEEQIVEKSRIDNIHERFDAVPDAKAWEKGFDTTKEMERNQKRGGSRFADLMSKFGDIVKSDDSKGRQFGE